MNKKKTGTNCYGKRVFVWWKYMQKVHTDDEMFGYVVFNVFFCLSLCLKEALTEGLTESLTITLTGK